MGALNRAVQEVILSGKTFSDYININTLFIAVIVLAVIILIMLITYFANIKPNLSSPEKVKSSPVDNVIAQITKNEEEELISDCELVAVITAAIYASMKDGVPADGLIVRSIKRADSRKR